MGSKALPKIISIIGVTASGKSGLGILLSQKFNGEIVSADSRQVYKGIDIASGKVTKEEQKQAVHHMIDVAKINARYDVSAFQRDAYKIIDDIINRNKIPIIVGGTGLYVRSIVEGYNLQTGQISERSSDNKRHSAVTAKENNPRYDVLQICLMPSKEAILEKVKLRTAKRLADGLIKETENLLLGGAPPEWLNSLGFEYQLSIKLINGEISEKEFFDIFVLRTMQYVKRQKTWFKKEKNTVFLTCEATYYKDSVDLITKFLLN